MIETAADFLLMIKETTSTEFDADAVEFLDALQKGTADALTKAGAVGDRRDAMMFWEGAIKGLQLKLARVRLDAQYEANEMGLDVATGNPKRGAGH